MRRWGQPVVCLLVAALGFASAQLLARKVKPAPEMRMTERRRALHAVNRLTFGPRPGDVNRVVAMGVDRWIEGQLNPSKIDDSALTARLVSLRTLDMSTEAMIEAFPPQAVIKALEDGKLPLPRDPGERAVYQAQLERYREQRERKATDAAGKGQKSQADQEAERRQAMALADELIALAPQPRYQRMLQMEDASRRQLAVLPPPKRSAMLAGLTPEQRETAMALVNPQQVVMSELREAKLLRAIYSQRQLEEVMTDFWFNHFNVFAGKGADHYLLTSYERDVIRPHALGKFKDLLLATAKSPAMLFYLDNWMSVGPESEFAKYGPRQPQSVARSAARMGARCGRLGCGPAVNAGTRLPKPAEKQPKSGLNENYARELMELHTLGVNGGYTQADVTQVAKVFTGWTLRRPERGGEFAFNDWRHEPGTKIVLGHRVKQHGEREGVEVLELLAASPATARFISTKLAERFVADDPPPGLVSAMAKTFRDSDGNIREVLRTMFHSPDFWSAETYRAKVKTPLEFVASAARACGVEVDDPMALLQWLTRMGMPLYGAQPPTGYDTQAGSWLNSGALLNRMNFALALARGNVAGANFDPEAMLTVYEVDHRRQVEAAAVVPADDPTLLAQLEEALLVGDVSRQTHEAIGEQLANAKPAGQSAQPKIRLTAALLLGSPEFQRR